MPASLAILALGIVGATLLFFLAWRRPTLAITVWVISSVVFSEFILLPDAPTLHVHLSRVLLVALLLGLAAGRVRQPNPPSTPARPDYLILALTAWTLVSACWSGTMFRVDGTRNASIFISGFLLPAMILFLARSIPLSLKVSRTVCTLLTVLLGYMIFTAFCEHFHINSLVFPQYILDPSIGIHPERARGPIINAAENGAIIAILLLVALHSLLYVKVPAVRWAGCCGVLLFGAAALWFTETRGPWVAFACGLCILLWHNQGRRFVLALGGASVLALGAFLLYAGVSPDAVAKKDPLPQRSDNTSDTVDFRMDLYRESVGPLEDHPLMGWGLGTFTDTDYLFDAYGSSLTLSTAVLHDTIFAITLESGIIGGILYISFLVAIALALIKLRRASRDTERQDFYTLCLASLVVFVVSAVFVDIRYFMPQNSVVFLLAGLGFAPPPANRLQAGKHVAEMATVNA